MLSESKNRHCDIIPNIHRKPTSCRVISSDLRPELRDCLPFTPDDEIISLPVGSPCRPGAIVGRYVMFECPFVSEQFKSRGDFRYRTDSRENSHRIGKCRGKVVAVIRKRWKSTD